MATELLNITINQDDIEKAISNAAKARTELDKLKAANKELEKQKKDLAKAEGDNTQAIEQLNKEIAKNNTQIKTASATVRENEKIVVANTQAQQANEGSIKQLRTQLGIVSQQWAALSEEERENTEEGKRLAKQKLELTERLKAEEKATGDTRRNVGNYTESVQEAIQSSGLFGAQLGKLRQAQAAYQSASNLATGATKSFRLALISTGIGAIVVALGALISAFASTQAGIDKVTSVTRPLTAVFQSLKGLAQDLATNVFGGLSKILSGDLKGGFADLKNGFKEAIGGIGDAVKQGVESGKELDRLQKQIEQTEIDLIKRRAELNAEFERSKEIAQDDARTEQERRAAAQRAIEAQNALLQQEQEFLDLRIQKKELENSLNDTSREDEKELAELIAQRTEAEALASRKRVSARNLLETIDKQIDADRLAALKEQEKAEQAALEKQLKLKEKIEKESQDIVTDGLAKLKESYAQGLIDKKEFEQQKLQIELDTLTIARINAELAKEEALNNIDLTEEQRINAVRKAENEIIAIREQAADVQIRAKEAQVKVEEKLNKDKSKFEENTLKDTLSTAQTVFGEETTAAKIAGIAQATISTYKGAAKALELGFPLGTISAALITAKGLLNVQKIVSTPTPSFADGGFTGSGYGSPDSSGYKPAGIVHEGEYVIKKSMVQNPNFAPIVSFLENSRLRGYADGGMVGRTASLPAIEGSQASQLQASITELRNIQPIVRVTDINRVSGQAQMVRVSGEL